MIGRVQEFVFTSGKGKAQGRHMIIELGNIHAKWKLLIESTCMLLANGNVTLTQKGNSSMSGSRDHTGSNSFVQYVAHVISFLMIS
jgi:hypothetical protein